MRVRLFIAVAAIPLVIWAMLPLVSGAAAPTQARLNQLDAKIDRARSQIGRKKGTERALSVDISAYSAKIDRLQGRISVLEGRQAKVQADLDAKQAELDRLRGDLRAERARLTRLRARLKVARRLLSQRLVEMYKASEPDVITVVLDSHGFEDLLERTEFLKRISAQDRQVVDLVQSAKADAAATEKRLATLETRQQRVTEAVYARREEIRQVKDGLVGTRVGLDHTKAGKQAALQTVRTARVKLEEDVKAMEKQQAKISSELGAPLPSGVTVHGSGRFVWPVRGPITAPFCEKRAWEACHPGMDIAVPTGTPIHAADSGVVKIAGWVGGYGNYVCIQHTASLSSCYGHQSAIKVRVGQAVRQGQVIGLSGSTGFSTGPHLHFEARVNGSVVNPLNYL